MAQNRPVFTSLLFFVLLAVQLQAQGFRVQLTATSDSIPMSHFKSQGIDEVEVSLDQIGIYHYSLSTLFPDREAAELLQQIMVLKGFSYAMVVDLEEQRVLREAVCGEHTPAVYFVQDSMQRFLFFESNSESLNEESKKHLLFLKGQLKAHPKLVLKLYGYSDTGNSKEISIKLATNRARAARNFLITNGIAPERMYIKVFGEYDDELLRNGEEIKPNNPWSRRVSLYLSDNPD